LEVAGQQLHPGHPVLLCRVAGPDDWCRACGCLGAPCDSVLRRLAQVPLGWQATILTCAAAGAVCFGAVRGLPGAGRG
jgi:hypothetical protein